MKSKLFILALSMFAMSFVAANGTVDAKTVLATGAAVEANADKEVAVADANKEVAAEEVAKAEAAKAKKAEETKAAPQDQNSCKSCK
jgi:CO/xanthine dehydrogenase FAD-binding subunit